MRLYHFAPAHLLHGILSEGLTRGCIPLSLGTGARFRYLPAFQWLTSSPSWNQGWNVRQTVRYDRTAFRLTLTIPKSARRHLYRWISICREVAPDSWEHLNSYGDPENWYVYGGRVPPGWVRQVEAKPAIL